MYFDLPMKYNKMAKTEFIRKENEKKESTKSKTEIKENLKQKIFPPTFCISSLYVLSASM